MPDSEFAIAARNTSAQIADTLEKRKTERVVLAESCTAGLAAALLGQHAGISNWLCGSAVTYRESVKRQWLDVSPETLEQHTAESLETTREMAVGVLGKTREATISAAVTGHLGPDAPLELDGKIFVAVARRVENSSEVTVAQAFQLKSSSRIDRQYETADLVLGTLLDQLQS